MSAGILHDAGKAMQKAIYCKSSAARSKGDVVYIGMDGDGFVDISLADDALVHCLGVWDQDVASGESGNVIVAGQVTMTVPSATYTEGNGLSILDGAVVDSAAAFPFGSLAKSNIFSI